MKQFFYTVLSATLLLASCAPKGPVMTASGLDPQNFVAETEGGQTALYVLTNASGSEACITNFGARIVSLMVPGKDGQLKDVVLGFDNINTYIEKPSAFGAVMGRYANRIGGAKFTLDGNEYNLPKNNGENCIHGGPRSWQYAAFKAESVEKNKLVLSYLSPDGEFGFPGEVKFKVTYTLSDDNKLTVNYDALTSAPTVLNVTNHSFFNLSGDPACTILDNTLFVDADSITPTDAAQIPIGEFMPVEGTAFDFRTAKPVGQSINDESDPQIAVAHGYDHNFVLNHPGDLNVVAAEMYSPSSGIVMKVYTDQPGVQVYSANNVNGTLLGKGGKYLQKQTAVCLETQHFPDSPNKPAFPSTVITPDAPFTSTTVFAFSVK